VVDAVADDDDEFTALFRHVGLLGLVERGIANAVPGQASSLSPVESVHFCGQRPTAAMHEAA
jgi:hypothetical protein